MSSLKESHAIRIKEVETGHAITCDKHAEALTSYEQQLHATAVTHEVALTEHKEAHEESVVAVSFEYQAMIDAKQRELDQLASDHESTLDSHQQVCEETLVRHNAEHEHTVEAMQQAHDEAVKSKKEKRKLKIAEASAQLEQQVDMLRKGLLHQHEDALKLAAEAGVLKPWC